MKLLAILFCSFLLILPVAGQDQLVKEINKEIDSILKEKNAEIKESKLKKILQQVKKISSEKHIDNLTRQIALCNYLIEQACILEALDGRGVGIVRKELTENINDHGLSVENKRYLRRLVELCEEAERSYTNVSYVEVDGSDAKADLLVQNIGAGVGISLALGDVTPLIASAVRIGRGYSNINKTKSRQLESLIQSHKARITNFLFRVNSFKNDLIAEQGVKPDQIITPEAYRSFLKILMMDDTIKKLNSLKELNEKFPGFRAVQFYLSNEFILVDKIDDSVDLLNNLITTRNSILHKDGFVGQAFTSLASINMSKGKNSAAIKYSTEALKENSQNWQALNIRSESYLKLKKLNEAYSDAIKAATANSSDPALSWNVCKIAADLGEKDVPNLLNRAIDKGFRDFETIKNYPGMKNYLSDWQVKSLLSPEISATYKAGVFKDDITIENTGLTILDKFTYNVDLRYFKKDKWEHKSFEGEDESFELGEKIVIKNKFSMKKDSRCSIKVSFTSIQNLSDNEIVVYYNFNGKKAHLKDWQYDLKRNWPNVLRANSRDVLQDLKKSAIEINEKSFYKNPDALSLLAHSEFKLGNKTEAVRLQKKALGIMKKTLPEGIYKISALPFEQALIKFSE